MRAMSPSAHGGLEATNEVVLVPGRLPTPAKPKGDVMNTTTAAAPVAARKSRTHVIRTTSVALAIVVLFAASFLIGRATASSAQHVPAATSVPATSVPATSVPVTAPRTSAPSGTESCHVGPC